MINTNQSILTPTLNRNTDRGGTITGEQLQSNNNCLYPTTKNTTAVFVVYILQIHLPRWFSPTKKTVLLRLQYHDYFYHSHSKSTTAVIVVLYVYHIS